MNGLLLNLLLAIVWSAAVGRMSLETFGFGFLLGYFLLWWLYPVHGDRAYFHKGPRFVGLALFFFWELFLSNLRVARAIVSSRAYRRPGILAVSLDAETDVEISLLGILVTLTPGTLLLDISDDRKVMYIHAMFVDDPDEVRRSIKEGFERRVLELLR